MSTSSPRTSKIINLIQLPLNNDFVLSYDLLCNRIFVIQSGKQVHFFNLIALSILQFDFRKFGDLFLNYSFEFDFGIW